jgi:hypothetical protein
MEEQITYKEHCKNVLIRWIFMLLFLIISRIIGACVALIAVFQLFYSLVARKPNANVTDFGRDLSIYLAEIVKFLSYATEDKPWPFSPWPQPDSEFAPDGDEI